MSKVKVIKQGALTTIQDYGRYGYQRFGIPVAGVMDEYSYKIANFLVGNDDNEAVLEMTYIGSDLEFLDDMVIAITGANLKPKINNQEIPMWQSLQVKNGDKLTFTGVKSGIRAYLAFGGKINVPIVNSSKSTTIKSKLGGYQGRALKKDDILDIVTSPNATSDKKLDEKFVPEFKKEETIRVVLGPQDDYFTQEGIDNFLSQDGYALTAESDRMGIRLDGNAISHKQTADIISDGAVIGSIQVPANGMPIILMADRQTTGGYTKIATVIKQDICKLAQMGTNFKIYFKKLTIEEAQSEYINFSNKLKDIKSSIQNTSSTKKSSLNETFIRNKSSYSTNINGKECSVEIKII